MSPRAVYTIGYEGIDVDRLIALLRENGVKTVLDSRWRPGSRKKGLSKTPLATALAKVGIAYVHERSLGTPPEIMRRLREEGTYDWEAYHAFLREQSEPLERACAVAQAEATCLLCYEADANECHRRIVAAEIAERTGLGVRHIPVTAL